MKSLNRLASALTCQSSAPTTAPTFSNNPLGSQSIWIISRVRVSSSRWNVTTPACLVSPSTLCQAMRSSGCCSLISVSNSRVVPPILVTQWLRVSLTWVIDSTPPMNSGKVSNCVHWLYATLTGTSTSMDSSTVLTPVTSVDLFRTPYAYPMGRGGNSDISCVDTHSGPGRPVDALQWQARIKPLFTSGTPSGGA